MGLGGRRGGGLGNTSYKIWRPTRSSTGQLYNPPSPSRPFHLSLASVPQLISMNIHYSMIFLLPHTNPGTFNDPPSPPLSARDSTLFVGSLIYNYDRQSEGSLLPTPFHSAVKAFRVRMLLEFQNLHHCLRAFLPRRGC